jgi:hypothetical protein
MILVVLLRKNQRSDCLKKENSVYRDSKLELFEVNKDNKRLSCFVLSANLLVGCHDDVEQRLGQAFSEFDRIEMKILCRWD